MAIVNNDTTHIVLGKSNEWLEDFVELQIVEEIEGGTLSGITISGTTGADGTSGTSGTSGTDGQDGVSGISTLVEISSETTLTGTSIYVRATGATYAIILPAATGSLEQVWVKNVGSGDKTVTAAGSDLIDGVATKTVGASAGAIFVDVAIGVWDIN